MFHIYLTKNRAKVLKKTNIRKYFQLLYHFMIKSSMHNERFLSIFDV